MEAQFDTLPIRRLVLKLGVPAMLAQFFNILYSIVDRIYVGKIPAYGELALASIGVSTPALTAVSAFAIMVGVGGASAMSTALGGKDRASAQRMINNAFMLLAVMAAAVTGVVLFWKRDLLYLLGCSDNMYPFANQYFSIYMCGTFAVLLGNGMNQFILAQGFARQGMLSVVIGALTNVVLDPIFIFLFGFGIAGAAVATVISQICAMCYVLRFLTRRDIPVRIGFGDYRKKACARILTIGMMPFLIMLLDNLIIIFLNANLRRHGGVELGDRYIAAAAVVQSFMVLVTCPAQGITAGCGTLYSYHYGAGNYTKVMQAFKYVLLLCGGYICLMFAAAQLIPGVFVRLFVRAGSSIAVTSSFIRKYTLGLVGIAAQYALVDGLTAMGKVRYALPISFLRKFMYIACIFLLPYVTELENIFYAGAISDILGAAFTLVVFRTHIAKKLKQELSVNPSSDRAAQV